MKKRHFFWIIPLALILGIFILLLITHVTFDGGWKSTAYKPKNKPALTQAQLREDVDYVSYYLRNAYIGYDQLVEQGLDVDACMEEVFANAWGQKDTTNKVASTELNGQLKKTLTANFKITDKHFAIGGWQPQNDFKIYWSDIYIYKSPDGYRILKYEPIEAEFSIDKSKNKKEAAPAPEGIVPGARYTGAESNLYEWFSGTEKMYRYAIFTKNVIQKATISVEGNAIYVPVSADEPIHTTSLWQGMQETEDTLYISFSDFVFGSNDNAGKRQFKKLCETARSHVDGKKNIIIDLRSNGGGEFAKSSYIIANLMFGKQDAYFDLTSAMNKRIHSHSLRLISPPIAAHNRKWYFVEQPKQERELKKLKKESDADWEEYDFDVVDKSTFEEFEKISRKTAARQIFVPRRIVLPINYYEKEDDALNRPDFEGTVYILTNHNSASCSEYTVAAIKILEQMFPSQISFCQIGENTNGAVSYVNPMYFNLPNSGIYMYLPTAYVQPFEDADYEGEGRGWMPDFWTTNHNLLNTLIYLTGDDALQETLAGIERKML